MNKLKIHFRAWLAVLILAIAGYLPQAIAVQAASGSSVTLAATSPVTVNTSFTVAVDIDQVNLLNAADYRITFDPGFLALDSVSSGAIGSQAFPAVGYKEVASGVCNVVSFTGDDTGLTGSGTLAVLTMHTLSQTGDTAINISEGVLSDNTASRIEADWTGTSLTVESASSSSSSSGGGGSSSSTTSNVLKTYGFAENTSFTLSSAGVMPSAASLKTSDGQLSLGIAKGAKLLTAYNSPLATLSVAALAAPPEAPSSCVIIAAYTFGPDGATFAPGLTLTLGYDAAALPASVAESSLYIAGYGSSAWESQDSTVDTQAKTVTAAITHFSSYALFGRLNSISTTPTVAASTPAAITDSSGKFTSPVTVKSDDGQAAVAIGSGTIGLQADGTPLTQISVTPVTAAAPSAPADYSLGGQVFSFGPNGATFNPPVTLTFQYSGSELAAGGSGLLIAWYDSANLKWVNLVSRVDTASRTVSASVSHFTDFALLLPSSAAASSAVASSAATASENIIPAGQAAEITGAAAAAGTPANVSTAPAWTNSWPLIVGVIVVCLALTAVIFRKQLFRRPANNKSGSK